MYESKKQLTEKEKYYVSRILKNRPDHKKFLLDCLIFYMPSLVFGLYGILNSDFIITSLAYITLLFLIGWNIYQNLKDYEALRSVLETYESNAELLSKSDHARSD